MHQRFNSTKIYLMHRDSWPRTQSHYYTFKKPKVWNDTLKLPIALNRHYCVINYLQTQPFTCRLVLILIIRWNETDKFKLDLISKFHDLHANGNVDASSEMMLGICARAVSLNKSTYVCVCDMKCTFDHTLRLILYDLDRKIL